MNLEQITNIIIEIILFLIASYFIFYKSWLASLGKEIAKLSTAQQLSRLTESVKNEFNEKIESFKIKLNEELTLKIEPLKSELAKNNITHQIQFSFLHQERAKAILNLYKKLIELHSSMVDWTRFMHPVINDGEHESRERAERANTAIIIFENFYLENKLFFCKSFCDYIDEVFYEYWDMGLEFGYSQERLKSGDLTEDFYKNYSEQIKKISQELKESLPLKLSEIESKFREMLNVEEE